MTVYIKLFTENVLKIIKVVNNIYKQELGIRILTANGYIKYTNNLCREKY